MTSKNILILGANGRNGVAAAGALTGHGYRLIGLDVGSNFKVAQFVHGACKPKVLDEILFYSKANQYDEAKLLAEFKKIIVENEIDLILPTGTFFTLFVAKYKAQLSQVCAVPSESYDKMEGLHDKHKTVKLCELLGVPVPKTLLITDQDDLAGITKSMQYPMVLKAREGAGNDGVWMIHSYEELRLIYSKNFVDEASSDSAKKKQTLPILQEYIPGDLYDVTSFSVKGEPLAVLSQVRVMTSPLWGGSGIINETTDHPLLKNYAMDIIKHVSWDGILEFDFKIDSRDGQPKLIEINPKIWGTTWLTVQAGFNMPLYLVKNTLKEPYDVPNQYKIGLCARWPLLEMGTWFEKPISAKILIQRVAKFISLFKGRNIVYDSKLFGFVFIVKYIAVTFLSKISGILLNK